MDASHHANLSVAVALAAGVLVQCISRSLRLPAIVGLLAIGVLLGPDFLNWVQPQSLGTGLYGLVDFGIAIILFEGGLNLQLRQIRKQEGPIRKLITLGAMVTLAGASVAARFWLGIEWKTAFLFGSLVVVTGPTVVGPLLRDMRLHPRLKTILEAEGVLIDPVGAVLAVVVLQLVTAPSSGTMLKSLVGGVGSVGFGLAAGLVCGFALSHLLRWKWIVPAGYESILTLGAIVLMVPGCDLVAPQSGILAVTIAGMVVGNRPITGDRELREFKDQLTLLMVAMLFVLLAANVRMDQVKALGWAGAGVVATLVLVVRPLGVLLSTAGSDLPMRDRFFLAWVAPRGIIAAAIASLTVQAMAEHNLPGGDMLRALVFLTITSTVVLAGLTARPVASLLRLRLPERNRVALLGAEALGRRLAAMLRDQNVSVVLLDSDPLRCSLCEAEGLQVVFGDALQDRTMMRAQFELVDSAIGITSNEHLNRRFTRVARESFRVPRAFIAITPGRAEQVRPVGHHHPPEPLFEVGHDLERWDVRVRQNAADLVYLVYQAPDNRPPPPAATEDTTSSRSKEMHIMMTVKRGTKVQPMSQKWAPKNGDIAGVLLHKPEREAALASLAAHGWIPPEDVVAPTKKRATTELPTIRPAKSLGEPPGSNP